MWAGQLKVKGSLLRIKFSSNAQGAKSGYHPRIEFNFEMGAAGGLACVQTLFCFQRNEERRYFSPLRNWIRVPKALFPLGISDFYRCEI